MTCRRPPNMWPAGRSFLSSRAAKPATASMWSRPCPATSVRTAYSSARDLRRAIRLSREIRAGTVRVNRFGEGDVTTPFGGYRHRASAGATSPPRPRPVHRAEDRLDRRFGAGTGRGREMTSHAVRRLPVDTGVSGWGAICQRDLPGQDPRGGHSLRLADHRGGLRRPFGCAPPRTDEAGGEDRRPRSPRDRRRAGRAELRLHDRRAAQPLLGGLFGRRPGRDRIWRSRKTAWRSPSPRTSRPNTALDREVFDPCGKINAAASERGLRLNEKFARSLDAIGERSEALDAQSPEGR